MTARNYDFILNVSNATNFVASNIVIGLTSKTTGLIVNADYAANTLKIKLSNSYQEFTVGERVISNASIFIEANASVMYYSNGATIVNGVPYPIDGTVNTFSVPISAIANYYVDAIDVFMNGFLLPKSAWVNPAITGLGKYGVTIKPIVYTKTTATDYSNLKIKVGEVIKDNYFNPTRYIPGSSVDELIQKPDFVSSTIKNYASIIPDSDLEGLFVGNAGDAENKTLYTAKLPGPNIANLEVRIKYASINNSLFFPGYKSNEVETANTVISSISHSKFIAAKNTFQQKPIVRLYTLYYPGEWYPPRTSGNPNSSANDVQYPWPYGFPVRFAEIRGDYISDITYRVQYGGVEYTPYPINSTGISLDSSGKINDVTFSMSNFDGLITSLLENAYLCGYNSSNNTTATVNGELVYNIDPRTNPSSAYYNAEYANQYGINTAWTYSTTLAHGDTWVPLKQDTRDLLGGVLEIKTTFADLLDFWPEYSSIIEKTNGNFLKMRTISPYRVGDIVHNNANTMSNAVAVITQLVPPYVVVNNAIHLNPGENLYIQNPDASSDEFVLDNFKINNLESLNDTSAQFSLTSMLQYFKNVVPKRSFLKNSCYWVYKGDECQYPATGTGYVPGSSKAANGFFTITNATTLDIAEDRCARNLIACRLRGNEVHFGAFPGTGISTPR